MGDAAAIVISIVAILLSIAAWRRDDRNIAEERARRAKNEETR